MQEKITAFICHADVCVRSGVGTDSGLVVTLIKKRALGNMKIRKLQDKYF